MRELRVSLLSAERAVGEYKLRNESISASRNVLVEEVAELTCQNKALTQDKQIAEEALSNLRQLIECCVQGNDEPSGRESMLGQHVVRTKLREAEALRRVRGLCRQEVELREELLLRGEQVDGLKQQIKQLLLWKHCPSSKQDRSCRTSYEVRGPCGGHQLGSENTHSTTSSRTA